MAPDKKLLSALHEAATYGMGATSDFNQKVILEAACETQKLREQIVFARFEALEEAARIAENGCLVPPDGGSPTEEEREMCESIASQIRLRKLKDADAAFAKTDEQEKS